MAIQTIAEVGIGDDRRVWVRPAAGDFALIYRTSMEVCWDPAMRRLTHPKPPRDWTAAQWFRQIVAAVADEYGIQLRLTGETAWLNVPADIRSEIEAIS